MIVAETAPPITERRFRGESKLFPSATETDKKQRVSVNRQAILLNEANTDPRSTEPGKNQWVSINRQAVLFAEANTSLVNKSPLIGHEHFTYTVNPRATSAFNFFDVQSVMQDFGEICSPAIQSSVRVLEPTAREEYIPEIISSSQSIRTVAAAIFDNVRLLTDKERKYLRKFYNRVYKTR